MDIKHILSHQKIYSRFYRIRIDRLNNKIKSEYIKVPIEELSEYSMPVLLWKYFKLLGK